jgi:hypothetical protein
LLHPVLEHVLVDGLAVVEVQDARPTKMAVVRQRGDERLRHRDDATTTALRGVLDAVPGRVADVELATA